MAHAPKIEVNKTKNYDYRATFKGYASGPSRTAATASAARTLFQNEVAWRSGKPYDTRVNAMSETLSVLKKARRHAIKRPWNFAGRIVLGAVAASFVCFIGLHHLFVNEGAPVKQENKAIVRGR